MSDYPATQPRTNTMAILSLVFAFVFWPLGIVFGHMARRQIRQTREDGGGLATAGLVLSYIFLAITTLVIVIMVAVVGSAANQLEQNGGVTPVGQTAPVTYEVTGSGSTASITYTSDANFNQAQEQGAQLPWTKQVTLGDGFLSVASLTAQSGGSDGEITCRITQDGEVISENTSSGMYAVVTCGG